MFVLAVTGGMGAGKSEASRLFAERGAVVLDLDSIAKGVVHAPGPVRDRIVRAFGQRVLAADGGVDDTALATAAFESDATLHTLDSIVHPAVLREVMTGLENLQLLPVPPRVVVLDVPLLVEAPALAEAADYVLAISAPEDVRLQRCLAEGMPPHDAVSRISMQATDTEREALADAVIENTGTVEEFRKALAEFWDREVAARES